MKFIPRIPFSYPEIGLLVLRLSVGLIFTYHGSMKLFGAGGVEGFATVLVELGVKSPSINAWIVALTEFLGGLALMFGVYARWAALPLIFIMLVAILTVTGSNGFNIGNKGFEYNFILIAALSAIFLTRSEKWHIKQ
ncbi:Membrane protein, distant similarity to thiosulphate:quinone oxidoreductase DoxD [Nitrospina watsonii]|uniref:Membrane protein, distant similarity to thiosulphate:quinone oxidoreductase DoxD n=1 Tax=Nitrospina watsonii TaxID=1323948 RepID=A0ABM9HCS7_9BACT|nr:Membrane protein, distant similarity to thiosulphate:quinone oxidoreductase DoxD [Nitrospina watsonii]